ncbi:MAG: penicillin-binding protein 1C [Fibrobacterota bacterium]
MRSKRKTAAAAVLFTAVLGTVLFFARPPKNLFSPDYAISFFSRRKTLLKSYVSDREQYRFPLSSNDTLPDRYVQALLTFEDKRFFSHGGIDLRALARASLQNIRAGRIVSGASTITMQTARLSRSGKRTFANKFGEALLALRMELHFSKKEILRLYAENAPMGGNTVGISAASYRYYAKPMEQLTWAEAATLAVLPNAPGLIHTGRNRQKLLEKRNTLLKRLHQRGAMDSLTCRLALSEEIPVIQAMPFEAPHFTQYLRKENPSRHIYHTTLDRRIQKICEDNIQAYYGQIKSAGITNCAVMISETETGKVRAYCGSADYFNDSIEGNVDIIQSPRSPGSLLKPFLTALLFERGPFTPRTLVQDIPTSFTGYSPANADGSFRGTVSISQALRSSLNVPYIRLLEWYGGADFYRFLKKSGVTSLHRTARQYGLPLILGSAEISMFEITQLYMLLGNTGTFTPLKTLQDSTIMQRSRRILSPAACRQTLEIMKDLSRPGRDLYWKTFSRRIPLAWKTGTSYSRKDGWAVGVNKDLCIAVWTGNSDGSSNAANGGISAAAPLLFSILHDLSPEERWYPHVTWYDHKKTTLCKESGYPAGPQCPHQIQTAVPPAYSGEKTCPFHQLFHIDTLTNTAVNSRCWTETTVDTSLFILPAPVQHIYRKNGIPFDTIPAFAVGCGEDRYRHSRMSLTYPREGTLVLVPRKNSREYERILCTATHQRSAARLFWYLDENYCGTTQGDHTIALLPEPGDHQLTIIDDEGFRRQVRFTSLAGDDH